MEKRSNAFEETQSGTISFNFIYMTIIWLLRDHLQK